MIKNMYFVALYGILFKENSEAAFSNYRLWEALGAMISFGYSSYLCASTKIIFMITILSLGMVNYIGVEYLNKDRIKVTVKNLKATKDDKSEILSINNKEDNSNKSNPLSTTTEILTIIAKNKEDLNELF